MIEVNLLPGAGKKVAEAGSSISISAAMLAGLTAGITDKFLLGAIGAVERLSVAVGACCSFGQAKRERTLVSASSKAVEDSAQFNVVLAAKAKAEATRDSLYQQVAIIKSIDDSRYLWPHLIEEISNALPQYTWLTIVTQTSAPPSSAVAGQRSEGSAGRQQQRRKPS